MIGMTPERFFLTTALLCASGLYSPAAAQKDGGCQPLAEESGYVSTWNGKYPSSQSLSNSSCTLCHRNPGGGNNYNSYGWDIKTEMDMGASISTALTRVESMNSDGDPCRETNLAEILLDTQPGWTNGPNNTTYSGGGTPSTGQTTPASVSGLLDPCFPNVVANGSGANPVVLTDSGGDPNLSPRLNSVTEPFAVSLDCSGAQANGVYLVQINPGLRAVPVTLSVGELLCSGPLLIRFQGVHARNIVQVGPVSIPNDPSFIGLSYCVQGFVGDPVGGGFLTNALQQTIGTL